MVLLRGFFACISELMYRLPSNPSRPFLWKLLSNHRERAWPTKCVLGSFGWFGLTKDAYELGFFTAAMERNNSSSISAPWVQIQQKTFTNWVNEQLRPAGKQVDDLVTDFEDGLMLITLLDSLVASRGLPMYKKRISYCKNPKLRVQKMENVSHALQMMERAGIKMVNVGKFKWITIMNACWWVMFGVRENQNGESWWEGTSYGHLSVS